MTNEEIFLAWCPQSGAWSSWAKPVLYAYALVREVPPPVMPDSLPSLAWLPRPDMSTALVFDLAGPQGAWLSPELARRGYRPVPLYNAMPAPADCQELVPVTKIISALVFLAPTVAGILLPDAAPPAFLLDAHRRSCTVYPSPGRYDNRSISLPSDFPTAAKLRERGISRVILVQPLASDPQPDLARTLGIWQREGIEIWRKALLSPEMPSPFRVRTPSALRGLWHWLIATLALRPHPLGGYGGILPHPSSG